MSNRSTPEPVKKSSLENGVDEDTSCLPGEKPRSSNRMNHYRERIVGDTKLSPGIKIAAITLGVLCIILFIIVIFLAAFWPRKNYPGLRCTGPECLKLSAMYLQRLDAHTSPCADPKQWACGTWIKTNINMVPSRPRWSWEDEIKYQEAVRLRNILTTMPINSSQNSLKWKTFYESCMAVENVESDGFLPLQKYINELGGWHVLREWNALDWSWRPTLEKLHVKYGAKPLFELSVEWLQDNTTYVHIKPSGLGLPDPSFYEAGTESKPVRAYKSLLKDAVINFGASASDAGMFADDVFAFEQRLAKIQTAEDMRDSAKIMTLKELKEKAQFLQIRDVLVAVFPKMTLTDSTQLMITSPKYITHLSSITTGTDPGILNDYFVWTLVREYLPYMSRAFRLIWREFQSQITGSRDDVERWEFCSKLIQKSVPLGVAALLESTYEIDDRTIESIQAMFETLKKKSRDKILNSAILSETMKPLMIEQIDGLTLQIGLRHEERSPSFLADYHKNCFIQKHNLFRNIAYTFDYKMHLLSQSYFDKNIHIIRTRAENLIEPRASFNELTKQITIPKVLLTEPNYHWTYPKSVQYARLGTIIATAIAKALALIEADSDTTIPNYAEPTINCLNKNIITTMLPNDMGSVNLASAAYLQLIAADLAVEASHDRSDSIFVLPELEGYGDNNLFALTYAQTKCSIETMEQITLENIRLDIDSDTLFRSVWNQINGVTEYLGCSRSAQCPKPF